MDLKRHCSPCLLKIPPRFEELRCQLQIQKELKTIWWELRLWRWRCLSNVTCLRSFSCNSVRLTGGYFSTQSGHIPAPAPLGSANWSVWILSGVKLWHVPTETVSMTAGKQQKNTKTGGEGGWEVLFLLWMRLRPLLLTAASTFCCWIPQTPLKLQHPHPSSSSHTFTWGSIASEQVRLTLKLLGSAGDLFISKKKGEGNPFQFTWMTFSK